MLWDNVIGLTVVVLMIGVPIILWTVALKLYFKENTVKLFGLALFFSVFIFALEEYIGGQQYKYKWTFEYTNLIIYLIYFGLPLVLLIRYWYIKKAGSKY